MEKNGSDDMRARLCSPYVNVVLIDFLAIAAFYLIAEHRAHLCAASLGENRKVTMPMC